MKDMEAPASWKPFKDEVLNKWLWKVEVKKAIARKKETYWTLYKNWSKNNKAKYKALKKWDKKDAGQNMKEKAKKKRWKNWSEISKVVI